MPLYEFIDPETGVTAEVVRSVEDRDKPLILRRRSVPSRIGVVAGGIPVESFNDTIRKAYYEVEQEKGSRTRFGHSANTIKSSLELPPT